MGIWTSKLAVAVLAGLLTAPAIAQEWIATPSPRVIESTARCALGYESADYFIAFNVFAGQTNLIIRSRFLIGVDNQANAVVQFPARTQAARVTLVKSSRDSDLALVNIGSRAELDAMVGQLAEGGDISVTVLGGRPTAFRLTAVPGAARQTELLRTCVQALASD
jgi:hypothetical protein